MDTPKTASIVPFTGRRAARVILSPQVLHGAPVAYSESRQHLMMIWHGIIQTELQITYPGGRISVLSLDLDFARDARLWGGDGISLVISNAFTAGDLSKAVENSVVFDTNTGKHYVGGAEHVITPAGMQPAPKP